MSLYDADGIADDETLMRRSDRAKIRRERAKAERAARRAQEAHGVSSKWVERVRQSVGSTTDEARELLREVAGHPSGWWPAGIVSSANSLLVEETECVDPEHDEDGSDCTRAAGCINMIADAGEIAEWLAEVADAIQELSGAGGGE